MKGRLAVALAAVGVVSGPAAGCTEAPETAREPSLTAAEPSTLEALGYDLLVDLQPGWMPLRTLRSQSGPVRVLAEARRPDRALAIAPKLIFTVEPCPKEPPVQIFRDTLASLRKLGDRPGVRVIRTGLLTRTLPEGLVGEIDLIYRLESQDKKRTIVHRSLAMPRPESTPNQQALVTLTATYLQSDAPLVGPEIDRIFGSFRAVGRR